MALDVVTVEYNANIDKLQQELNQAEQSFKKTDQAATSSGKKIETAYQRPAGVLQKLQGQLKVLQDAQQKAFSPASVISLQRKIDETKGKIAALTGEINKSGGSMVSTFKNVAASIGVAFGAQQLIRFGQELVKLALDAEEVKIAFKGLNQPQLLDSLRKAVSGTVDDLTLMKSAVRAESLKIPLEDLATLFEFAERQAGRLGQTTEQTLEAILAAIGSRSRGSFKALGIDIFTAQGAMEGLNFETAKIADISREVTTIARQELDKMGESIDSKSDKVARAAAQWRNFKLEAGEAILSVIAPLVSLTDTLGGVDNLMKTFINSASGGFLGLASIISSTTRSSAADLQFLGGVVAGLQKQLATDIPEEFRVDVFKDIPKSIAALNEDLAKLKTAFDQTESLQQRALLLDRITQLTDEITIATGGETEAMKANRVEREKQNEATRKFNESLTEAKKNLVLFSRLLPILQGAADAVTGAGETSEEIQTEIDNRNKRIDAAIREARAALQLNQNTLEDKKKLLAFERDQELKNTELTESERLLIIQKYRDKEKELEDQAKAERVERVAQTVSDIRGIAAGANEVISEIISKKLNDELSLIEDQRESQLASLDKQLENEKLSAKQRESILKQRAALEEDFEKKTEAAREEAAKKQLKFTIAGIVLNQSAAIASAIAGAVAQAAGNPIGIAAILAITLPLILTGMAQAMSAANAVELAEGEVDIKGPGTTTSDSIPARLSRRESVINAKGTALDPDLLRAMNKGAAAFEEHIQHTYVWPYMEAMIKAHSKPEGRGMTFSDRNILKELRISTKVNIKNTQALLQALYRRENNRGKRA